MGFETMRPSHSRIPNLTVATIVVCFFLTYNWWSLSTRNYELVKRTEEMGEQLKACGDERTACDSRRGSLESRLRDTESKTADLIRKRDGDAADKARDLKKISQDLQFCQTELESSKKLQISKSSMLTTMKMEKETMVQQLAEAKAKIEELESAVKVARQSSTATAAKDSKQLQEPSKAAASSTSASPKVDADNQIPAIVNDPVQGGDHEFDNVAIEELDDQVDPLQKPSNQI